ncbi:MAG: SRPBCC domain-containing protein, partial [Rhodoglobus sp.]
MTELTITRTLAAPPERVWRAWTTPEEYAAWIWPETWGTTCEIDLRIGGRFRFASTVRELAVSGEYVAVEAPHRLVQTWKWDGDDEETLVTVTFAPLPEGGTELTVLHERFATQEECDQHLQGWNDCLDRLPG